MKATAWEFRLRYWIHLVIYVLGFTAPWDRWLHLDSIRTWQLMASWPARSKWLSFSNATIAVLAVGIVLALLAALLRTWGAAYMDASVVHHTAMHGEQVVADGPYRRVRNPLYDGMFLHTLALALLMPPSGAVFAIVLIGVFQLRLILAEEVFLTEKLGEPYRQYCSRVPRLLPALQPKIPGSGVQASWGMAFLSEIYMWGVFVSFAALGWRYNSMLILQGVIVSLGVSLVTRAFLPKMRVAAE
ncbi:methyltransferase family protein [Edaphobacter albus]|uniref:methyltransferase family protein n=1 Tax=Edaphobacter sp. 4G125 TaxID=2763071 RepID=UPI001645FF6B|nr:isoprenylcysteine carboxylmethyltransferase family protein [Edaphobacter sp. 4G125]QNI37007.1 isoprenylcysteine carboxylmethyltransferase family protein [Edaphobacter sp. 4G125]